MKTIKYNQCAIKPSSGRRQCHQSGASQLMRAARLDAERQPPPPGCWDRGPPMEIWGEVADGGMPLGWSSAGAHVSHRGGVSRPTEGTHTNTAALPHDPCVTPYPGPPGYCLSLGSIHRSASSTYVCFFLRLVLGLPATHGGQTEETHKNEPVHILFVDLSLVGAPTWLVACAHL